MGCKNSKAAPVAAASKVADPAACGGADSPAQQVAEVASTLLEGSSASIGRKGTMQENVEAFREKMEKRGLKKEFINGWLGLYERYCSGDTGIIREGDISPVTELPELDALPEGDAALLAKTVVLKLNGGLGTGMGLDKAKSLLEVKEGNSFLDLIAKQVLKLREQHPVRFMLMNSFSTEADTKEFFAKYPAILEEWEQVAFEQNMAPKIDKETSRPGEWPSKPSCEWCPPGHGDIYAALVVSGKLDKLIAEGYKYMFVSNSDNLGATLDLKLLSHLATSGAPMLMEVCVRGEDDKKGGHLAKTATGAFTLRESAQCAKEDEMYFQDISRHRYFNTNNLWLDLEKLHDAMSGGVLALPLIVNEKKMDPSSKDSPGPKVVQLETAMGAAISALPSSLAVCVPFSRFAPVKTCNQLLGLRSDAFVMSEDFTPVLADGACKPVIALDDNYKMVPDFEAAFPNGLPSLKACSRLSIKGKVRFAAGAVLEGSVDIVNSGDEPLEVGGTLSGKVDAETIRGATKTAAPAEEGRVTELPSDFQPQGRGGLFGACCAGAA
jgi:UDP-N-acetylglucosamine pyrophosphorylase